MLVRSPVTVIPVLVGPVPGVTVTVRKVLPPGSSELGLANPAADRAPPPPQKFVIELLRGIGPLIVKSKELLSVSVQPLLILIAAVVFESGMVAAVSAQSAVP